MTSPTPDIAELRRLHSEWQETVNPYGFRLMPSGEYYALVAAVVNALPDLLDAAAERDEAMRALGKLTAERDAEPDRIAELTAERDAMAAKVERVREWIHKRGVDVSDRDDDYMRGYRAAQRHALLDAHDLRRALDADA